jgi:hypothetical protein
VTGGVLDRQRSNLSKLRDEFAVRAAGEKPTTSLESVEWKRMHLHTRCVLLMVAGVDGDLEALGARDWHELPHPERVAILYALCGRNYWA